jgi:starvation-inducible DNA-binding protein
MTDALKTDAELEEKPHISVADDVSRQRLSQQLAMAVADTYMLLVKTQGYHWNVAGPLFVSIHELTESQYEDMFDAADDLAERIRALGERSPGSYREFAEITAIEDDDGKVKSAKTMVETLAHDNEKIARRLKQASDIAEDLGDKVSEDMLIERMQVHEQNAWMLRAVAADG